MYKNGPVMPRTATAGQRTTGEMTSSLRTAGYDTTRLEAHVIAAKALGAASGSKRKRDEDGMDLDLDGGGGDGEDGAGEWVDEDRMDVDGAAENEKGSKRAKGNSGGVVLKGKSNGKVPKTDRMVAGFGNSEVRLLTLLCFALPFLSLSLLFLAGGFGFWETGGADCCAGFV